MRKLALGIVVAAAALLTACGPAAASELVATAESEALAAIGVDDQDLAAAESDDGSKADDKARKRWLKRHPQKVLLHRNVLHGEAVVQTKQGPVTVVVQRGEILEVTADSITVRSSDGFTLTWSFHEKLRVIEKRHTIQPDEIQPGVAIALAGPKEGDTPRARLIVLRT